MRLAYPLDSHALWLKCHHLSPQLVGCRGVQLPEWLTELRKLEELDVTNNDIGRINPRLGFMEKLRCLRLEGNPLRSIRRPILERGTAAVLEYLRDRVPSAATSA